MTQQELRIIKSALEWTEITRGILLEAGLSPGKEFQLAMQAHQCATRVAEALYSMDPALEGMVELPEITKEAR